MNKTRSRRETEKRANRLLQTKCAKLNSNWFDIFDWAGSFQKKITVCSVFIEKYCDKMWIHLNLISPMIFQFIDHKLDSILAECLIT